MPDTKKIVKVIFSKKKQICFLHYDNGEQEEISLDLVNEYALTKGKVLSSELYSEIKSRQRKIDLKKSAYQYASFKPRTCFQVKDKLQKLGYNKEEINTAIDFLTEFEYLDDVRFANNYVKDILLRKSLSPGKLMMELQKKGIDRYTAEDAVNENFPHDNIYEIALKAAEKKMRMLASKPKEKQKSSLFSYLQRQGFNHDIIKNIMEDIGL